MSKDKSTDRTPYNLRHNIDRLLDQMLITPTASAEYKEMAARLETLYKLKEVDSNVRSKLKISPETYLTVAAHLATVVLVLNSERTAVLTSKALPAIGKLLK